VSDPPGAARPLEARAGAGIGAANESENESENREWIASSPLVFCPILLRLYSLFLDLHAHSRRVREQVRSVVCGLYGYATILLHCYIDILQHTLLYVLRYYNYVTVFKLCY
jgi:hypothetical protein